MTPQEFIDKFRPCKDGADFALQFQSMAEAWEALERPDWALWVLEKLRIQPERELRLFACWCARSTPLRDERTVWDLLKDSKSKAAIEVAERFAENLASSEELEDAYAAYAAASAAASAYASASAAASAAYASAAYASAASAAYASAAYAAAAYASASAASYHASAAASAASYHAASAAASAAAACSDSAASAAAAACSDSAASAASASYHTVFAASYYAAARKAQCGALRDLIPNPFGSDQ